MRTPLRPCHPTRHGRGFTMIELMITVIVLGVVMLVLTTVMLTAGRTKASISNSVEAAQGGRIALDMIGRDLRSAGFGADRDWTAAPQQPIAYIDSLQVLINVNMTGDVAPRDTTAYNPAGNPKPAPLSATAWTPPIKYRTGAEVVRWTLDVNNDGLVNSSDVSAPEGQDARRTRNPNDYVLVREVFGDSTGLVAGNNGGTPQSVALVRRPTDASIPPMFRVYLRDIVAPWDWSNGPIPVAQLDDIERISVAVVAPSNKPDWRGRYAESRYRTEVNSFRNVPNFGDLEYAVDGYVYNDVNSNQNRDAGEPGIAGAIVRLGSLYSASTSATGYFLLQAPAGTYTLRHTPATGYYTIQTPDSFGVTFPPATSRNFADKPIPGGYVKVEVYNDVNKNSVLDTGEPMMANVKTTVNPGPVVAYTDVAGKARLFAPVGGYSVSVEPPDSFVVMSANPQSGSMVNGDSTSHRFAMVFAGTAVVQGKVFRDNDRDGVFDAGEPGIQNVYVAVTPDGMTIKGYANTDANGDYSITVMANNPPGTQPYYVMAVPPGSHYATSSLWVGPLILNDTDVVTGKNFGMVAFQVITLNASRVLSLSSTDLIEKDWNGADNLYATKGHQDAELILGADAGGLDNVSVWFNKYDVSPVFDPAATYTRTAPQSVLSLSLNRLDTGVPIERQDLVTGTKNAGAGNFFVWLNQNTPSANLGYFPTTYTRAQRTNDAGEVTAVLTIDCAGGTAPDIVVGTKSPTAGRGTFEVWQNNEGATPTFSRQEIYPPTGNFPGNSLGEVTGMALADFDHDGDKDMVLGTKITSYSGDVMVVETISKNNGSRYRHKATYHDATQAVTAITVTDVDGDGFEDIIAGVQSTTSSGAIQYWRNLGALNFTLARTVAAPGIVMSLCAADLGGTAHEYDGITLRRDLAMGWRENETSFVGGIRIYNLDSGTLPAVAEDPSAGSIVNMVPAMTANNFNYGTQPVLPPLPYLTDLAAGIKITNTTGALVVFIR